MVTDTFNPPPLYYYSSSKTAAPYPPPSWTAPSSPTPPPPRQPCTANQGAVLPRLPPPPCSPSKKASTWSPLCPPLSPWRMPPPLHPFFSALTRRHCSTTEESMPAEGGEQLMRVVHKDSRCLQQRIFSQVRPTPVMWAGALFS